MVKTIEDGDLLCHYCGRALIKNSARKNWCPACKVVRPPFWKAATATATTASPVTTPLDDNLSTRGD